jgi:hypothetical protein
MLRNVKHNNELYSLYFSPNIIRIIKEDELDGGCSAYMVYKKLYKILVGKPEGKRQFRRPRH